MDVFDSIQNFIVNYEINVDKNNIEQINSEKSAIYNSIVTIMKNMTNDSSKGSSNGRRIMEIISPNFDKIKENISRIKELPEINLNYLAVDLLIFKSLLFIYYQMNQIPNFTGTFIEHAIAIRLRDEKINDRDDYSYIHSMDLSSQPDPLKLFLLLKLNSPSINFSNKTEWKTNEEFKDTTGAIKSKKYELTDDKYANMNMYNVITGCSENTLTGLYKGDPRCQIIRDRMTRLHDSNIEEQFLPIIGNINRENRGFQEWYPDIYKESVIGVGKLPWYTPPTYFLSLLSTNIDSDGLLFTSRKFLINSEDEYRDFFVKIAQIFSNYIIKAKLELKENYNGFSMPFAITRKHSPTHYIIFSCDKDDFFYYTDAQLHRSLYMFKIIYGPDNSVNIDTESYPEKDIWFKKYMQRMNFLDKYKLDEIEKDGKKIPNPDKDEGINGFELFFWADTYTDNLKNETEETKFNYISQISQNILFIEADKPFVKKDYIDALTFGGRRTRMRMRSRPRSKSRTMKKHKNRRRKTVRGGKKKNTRRRA